MKISIDTQVVYDITIGNHIFEQAATKICADKEYFVCVDENVLKYHQHVLESLLNGAVDILIIKATEDEKTMATSERILAMLFNKQASKKAMLVAIGGGITGDIVGYAASLYMRGIAYIQVPTTLLSQVDSSIGGKVAINQFNVKNIIGSFHSPIYVIIDIAFLESLTDRLFKSGFVELLKHGFIRDVEIIELCSEVETLADLRKNDTLIQTLIERSLQVKKTVVEADFYDTGIRHILNFGHTFAHALEMSEGTHLYHGECVAVGMLVMAKLNQDSMVFTEMKTIFEKFACIKPLKPVDFSKMMYDKKSEGTMLAEIFLPQIGQAVVQKISVDLLRTAFEKAYAELNNDGLQICPQAFVFEKRNLHGTVNIPPSKSMAHRMLLAAALSQEHTVLSGMYELADDVKVTMEAITTLGICVQWNEAIGEIEITPAKQVKELCQPKLDNIPTIQMGESGTSLRLLLPVLIQKLGALRVIGQNQLPFRPLRAYFEIFTSVNFIQEKEGQYLPLYAQGVIGAKEYHIAGDVSSQFLSGLLFTLPLIAGDSKIILTTPLESKPYVEMTLEVLTMFGIKIEVNETYTEYFVKGEQSYKSKGAYYVEQDYSSRCFFEVANLIGEHPIKIVPAKELTLQGDAKLLEILQTGKPLDLTHIPDTAPIAAIYYAIKGGQMLHTERLQYKESNRLGAICEMLKMLDVSFTNDERKHILTIHKHKGELTGGKGNTYHDHRLTMALIIASTVTKTPIVLAEVKSINKSYASFLQQYEKLGGNINEQ